MPCRLGTSAALDAAVDALITAHARFCVGNLSPDLGLLAKHSRALSILRHDLNDPIKAHSSETLCSIMLLMIYQTLTKSTKNSLMSHPDGAARILKSRGYSGPCNNFESKLLSALRGPVIVEALMKDEVTLTQQEWNDLVLPGYDGANGDGSILQCLARVPNLLQRCREVLPYIPFLRPTFIGLKDEVEFLSQNCKAIIVLLRDRLGTINENSAPTTFHAHIHAHYIPIYCMGLATGVILNCILNMLEDDHIWLGEESSRYSNEIFQLAKSAVKFQPLGSAAMILYLSVAWLGAPDSGSKDRVRSLLYDYERACLGLSPSDLTADLERLSTRFILE
ncbi:MAG: hypothetical protein M1827_007517 [Pycnora praestabilis]|nr:MAG: hypothetical protein M1827_007517 [Pycnora praestabilis]